MQPQIIPTRPTLYEYLEDLPEILTGEILDGQLYTQPRPSGAHVIAGSTLGIKLGSFHEGSGGPGGWWIIDEPEIHFAHNVEVTVPDLAGWRRERMPVPPMENHRFKVVPDWVCEILSPSTASKDRQIKMPLYARYGVQYAWLIDPIERVLEAYRLDAGAWLETGRFADTDQVAVPPFEAVSIDLAGLWPPARLAPA